MNLFVRSRPDFCSADSLPALLNTRHPESRKALAVWVFPTILFWLKCCPPAQVNIVSWMESVFVFVFYVFVFWLKYCPQTMVCIINEGHDRGVGSPEGGPASIHRWYHIITPSKYYHIRPSVKISSDWSKYSCERYYMKENKGFVSTQVGQGGESWPGTLKSQIQTIFHNTKKYFIMPKKQCPGWILHNFGLKSCSKAVQSVASTPVARYTSAH